MSFTSDFSKMGSGTGVAQGTGAPAGGYVLQEEKRLIDKVFDIIDRDQSGSIDTSELVEMFQNMGMEQATTTAVERIMQNVDRDHSEAISREEFYKFLSSKLSKNDKIEEIQNVFKQFDRNRDNAIDANELKDVASQLGENLPMSEIKEMLTMFATDGQKMTWDDFYKLMCEEIPGEGAAGGSDASGMMKGASGSSLGTAADRMGGLRGSVMQGTGAFQGGVEY
jgi:Ca2+-binding EF-hand superfamily protein